MRAALIVTTLGLIGGAAISQPVNGAQSAANAASAAEDLTAQLRRAVAAAADGDPDALIALRSLRDPALRPLFAHLASAGRGEQRVQAALGLAELDEPPRLDPFLLTQVETPSGQIRTVDTAWALGMLPPDVIRSLLGRPDLAPELQSRLALLAAEGGIEPDAALVRRLASSEKPGVAVTGGLLLAHLGLAEEARAPLSQALIDNSPEGVRTLEGALYDAGRLGSKGLTQFVSDAISDPDAPAVVVANGVRSLLVIDATAGSGAWKQAFERSADLAQRLRLAMIALESADVIDGDVFDAIGARTDAPVFAPIADAGAAASGKRLGESDLIALVETDYPQAVAWAVTRSGALGSIGGSNIRVAAISRLRGKDRAPWALMEECVRAAAALAAESADDFARAYTSVCWDKAELPAQVMLLGALRARTDKALGVIAGVEPPGAESKALAAVCIARGQLPMSPEQEETLRQAAAGRGGLSVARRAQAAWLALRRSGQDRSALAVVLTPE